MSLEHLCVEDLSACAKARMGHAELGEVELGGAGGERSLATAPPKEAAPLIAMYVPQP